MRHTDLLSSMCGFRVKHSGFEVPVHELLSCHISI